MTPVPQIIILVTYKACIDQDLLGDYIEPGVSLRECLPPHAQARSQTSQPD